MTLQVSPQTKRVFHLSLPIFAELLLQLLVGNMDQFMISHFGSAAVAAIGNGNQVMNVVIIVLTTMSTAATILLTQHIGAGRVGEECSEIVTVAVTVSAVFSFLVGLFLLLEPELVFQLLRTPEDAFAGACLYTRIVGGTVLLQGLYIQLCAVLRSYTLLKEVVTLSVVMNLLNVVGNAILINGFFGFPQMGVAGAAVSTVFSKAVGLTLACLLFMKRMADVAVVQEWEYVEDTQDDQGRYKPVPAHVMVYEVTGPMFFGAADKIPHMDRETDKSVLVLRMRAVPALDITALNGLRRLWEECRRQDIQVVFSHVNEQPMSVFQKSGLLDEVGRENFQPNIDAALDRAAQLDGVAK